MNRCDGKWATSETVVRRERRHRFESGLSPRIAVDSSPTRLVQWESACLTHRLEVVRLHHRVQRRCEEMGYFSWKETDAGSNPARSTRGPVAQLVERYDLPRAVHGASWDRSIDGDAPGSYPGEQGSSPCDPTTPREGRMRKVADSGVQPASKAGPAARLRVRLLHLPPLPNGVTGSTPGSEPGGRGSSPRLAAHVIVVSTVQHATPPRWKWVFEPPRSHPDACADVVAGQPHLHTLTLHTPVTEQVYVLVSETSAFGHVGSTPTRRTGSHRSLKMRCRGEGSGYFRYRGHLAQGSTPFPGPTGFPATTLCCRCDDRGVLRSTRRASRGKRTAAGQKAAVSDSAAAVGSRWGPVALPCRAVLDSKHNRCRANRP